MAYALWVMEKLGLISPKTTNADELFDTRLTRIQSRETRLDDRVSVFVRNPA